MKRVIAYAGIVLVVVAVGGWFVGLYFSTALDHRAIATSAALAFVVQLSGFVIAWRMRRANAIAGWAVGAVLCMVTLVLYGFAVRPLGLPIESALLSLAGFFFVTETLEPLFLA